MAEEKDKNFMGFGNKEQPPAPEPEPEIPELTAEELDKLILEDDPDFSRKIKHIGNDKNLSLSIIDLDNLDEALFQETEKWRSGKLVRRTIYLIYPNIPKLSLKVKSLILKAKLFQKNIWQKFKDFLSYLVGDGRRALTKWFIQQLLNVVHGFRSVISNFKNYSLKAKLFFFLFVGILAGTLALALFFYNKKTFHSNDDLYISSLKEIGTMVFDYHPETEVEPFYDNIRSAPNLLMLERIVVNIKKSKSSGENPMAAFEFFVEGLNPEVIVEVKDKEVMIRDLTQRTIEQYSFDDLDTSEGKRDLTQRLALEISRNLTTGKIKAVRIKTMFIKP